MARANLNINTQINEEFLRANESNDVRILKIKIEEEDLVVPQPHLKGQDSTCNS